MKKFILGLFTGIIDVQFKENEKIVAAFSYLEDESHWEDEDFSQKEAAIKFENQHEKEIEGTFIDYGFYQNPDRHDWVKQDVYKKYSGSCHFHLHDIRVSDNNNVINSDKELQKIFKDYRLFIYMTNVYKRAGYCVSHGWKDNIGQLKEDIDELNKAVDRYNRLYSTPIKIEWCGRSDMNEFFVYYNNQRYIVEFL